LSPLCLTTALLASTATAERFVVATKSEKSAFVASFNKDPAQSKTGDDSNALIMSLGTSGWLNEPQPPFVFVAYASGKVEPSMASDVNNLFNKKVNISDAGAVLYVHYGLGEYCDMDGTPGFGGAWPPNWGDLVKTAFNIGLSKEAFKTDTFLTAAAWNQAQFKPLLTGEADGKKFAEISTVDGPKGTALYSQRCRSGGGVVNGLDIGDFRFKCDFTLRFDGYWYDQVAPTDRNVLIGNLTADEAVTMNKQCPPAKRKVALLAFLAGQSVKDSAVAMSAAAASAWKRVPIGDAEFAFVNEVSVLDKAGKDSGKKFAATAQIQPVANLIDTKNWPPFLKESKAILFTFEASRDDLKDGGQIYFDPTFGFASDPAKPASSDKGDSTTLQSLFALALVVLVALLQ